MNNKIKLSFIAGVVGSILAPLVAFAAPAGPLQGVKNIILALGDIVGYLMPIAFALALVALFWGVAKYIFSAGDEEAAGQGKRIMIGGVIGIAVISLIWGLVIYIADALQIDRNQTTRIQPGFTSNQPDINP